MLENWKEQIQPMDDRRDIIIPGNYNQTIEYCVNQFIAIANACIDQQNYFAVALSGGSTPKAIYQALASPTHRNKIDWSKVLLFWSDERSVPTNDKESNYHMAMEAGLASLPLKPDHIFRMKAEDQIEEHSTEYERLILTRIPKKVFDVVLLGLGEDGHIASLFPKTHGLKVQNHLVVANYVPEKETWRMSLTYPCINASKHILLYVLGKNKAEMVSRVFTGPYEPDLIPAQKVGTPTHRALWILDEDAASLLSTQTTENSI